MIKNIIIKRIISCRIYSLFKMSEQTDTIIISAFVYCVVKVQNVQSFDLLNCLLPWHTFSNIYTPSCLAFKILVALVYICLTGEPLESLGMTS